MTAITHKAAKTTQETAKTRCKTTVRYRKLTPKTLETNSKTHNGQKRGKTTTKKGPKNDQKQTRDDHKNHTKTTKRRRKMTPKSRKRLVQGSSDHKKKEQAQCNDRETEKTSCFINAIAPQSANTGTKQTIKRCKETPKETTYSTVREDKDRRGPTGRGWCPEKNRKDITQ